MYAIACQGRKGYVSSIEVVPDLGADGGICVSVSFDPTMYLIFESPEVVEYYVEFLRALYLDDDFIYVCL